MLAGGSRLGIKHQGHIVTEDVRLENLWSTIFDRLQVPLPENFQRGDVDGIIQELVIPPAAQTGTLASLQGDVPF